MFQKALQFKDVIILCYSRYNTFRINGKVPPFPTWHIFNIIVDSLFPIVTACVLNQYKNHLLFSNALKFAITMCLKFKEEIINPSNPVNSIDDNFGITFELSLFAFNIIK